MKMLSSVEDVMSLPWQKNPEPLRNRGGVYRVVERATGDLRYVGQSSNVGFRLYPSVHPVYRRDLHDIYVLFVDDSNERGYLEGRIIELLKPALNRRAGLHPKLDENIKREYYDLIFN